MNTAMRTSLTRTYLKRPNGQGHDQNYCWQRAPQMSESTLLTPQQLLLLLPFELLLKHFEGAILNEYEVARGLYSESARGLDNAFMKHVDEFKVTVRATLEKLYTSGNK